MTSIKLNICQLISQNCCCCCCIVLNVFFLAYLIDGDGGSGGGCTGPKECDVAIVGGGLSGLYMAESLLRHGKETQVCVFERDERLGGRIHDHVFLQVPNVTVGKYKVAIEFFMRYS